MKGLYFYKLVSPYEEDVTKDCKLTINEIDHNFITLKDADIKEVTFDSDSKTIKLKKNNCEEFMIDLSSMVEGITTNLKVDYDSVGGIITIEYNGERYTISGLITRDNISKEVLTEIISDGTLSGLGSKNVPLGIAAVEKTGFYKPAKKLIDRTIGEFMPCKEHLVKGDRFVTKEYLNKFGFLYNFAAVGKIAEDLKNGWRIPTKEDWDNMLNAIEPCDEFRNHDSSLANNELGKLAGKYLKSEEYWAESDCCVTVPCDCGCCDDCNCGCNKPSGDGIYTIADTSARTTPNQKRTNPKGIDSYGFGALPAGFSDGCDIEDYFGKRGIYWTSSVINQTDVYVKRFDFNKAGVVQKLESPRNKFSLRLVKDYDGSNHQQVEFINGVNYKTLLLPSMGAKHGCAIWTATNVAFEQEKYNPYTPNCGSFPDKKKIFFINEWNGFEWEKKQMEEGESVVLLRGLKNEENIAYRVVNGELVSESNIVFEDVVESLRPELDEIHKIIGDGLRDEEGNIVESLTDKAKGLDKIVGTGFTNEEGEVVSITKKLSDEIDDRIGGDEMLNEKLEDLDDKLDSEISARETADTILQGEIDKIEESVGLGEDGEYVKREDSNYVNDAESVADAVDLLDKALKDESDAREELNNRMIKQEQPDDAFNCAKGLFTLHAEDEANNVIVKLNGDYGVLPYKGEE